MLDAYYNFNLYLYIIIYFSGPPEFFFLAPPRLIMLKQHQGLGEGLV